MINTLNLCTLLERYCYSKKISDNEIDFLDSFFTQARLLFGHMLPPSLNDQERNNEKNERDKIVHGSESNNGSEIKLKTKNKKRRLSFKEARELKELNLKLPLLEKEKIYLEKKIHDNDKDITAWTVESDKSRRIKNKKADRDQNCFFQNFSSAGLTSAF